MGRTCGAFLVGRTRTCEESARNGSSSGSGGSGSGGPYLRGLGKNGFGPMGLFGLGVKVKRKVKQNGKRKKEKGILSNINL